MPSFFGPSGAEKEQEARDYLQRFAMMLDVTASSLGFTTLNQTQDQEYGIRLQNAIIKQAGLKPYMLQMIVENKFESTKRMIEVAGRLKNAENACIFLPTTAYSSRAEDYHAWRKIDGNLLMSLRELNKTSRGLQPRDMARLKKLEHANSTARKKINATTNSKLIELRESIQPKSVSKVKPKPKGKGRKY